MIKSLVEKSADINIVYGSSNWTYLMKAALDNSTEIVDFLIDQGADLNHQGSEGFTALYHAAQVNMIQYKTSYYILFSFRMEILTC